MSVVTLSEAQLRAQVKAICDKAPDARVIGISALGPWTGPPSILVGSEEVDVAFCPSPLALRERLAPHGPDERRLVLITDRTEAELGGDVVARLAKRRLWRIDPWRMVLHLFRARELDPRVRRDRWLAEALLEWAPAEGFQPVAGGVLDEDTVWATVAHRVGLPDPRPDARALLSWTLAPEELSVFEALPAELKAALVNRLSATAGQAGAAILRCAVAGRGADAVPIGLVCRVLFGSGADAEFRLREAAVRLEPAVGGELPSAGAALGWADAAETVIRAVLASGGARAASPWLDRAEIILRDVRAEDFAHQSPVLVSGFEQRLVQMASVLSDVLMNTRDVSALPAAAAAVLTHTSASERPDRVETMRMACRLAGRVRDGVTESRSFVEAAGRYAADGGYADWARSRVWDGDSLPAVSEAYRGVSDRVAEARDQENRRFGALLAEWTALGSSSDAVIPIEDVLSRVLVPLAEQVPVLLLVADGMSVAVFQELLVDLVAQGWTELGDGDPPMRRPVIAALPTTTTVSRTSLLCGALRRGTSQMERDGFRTHPGLVAASRSGFPPVLFHKGDLIDTGGVGLAAAVQEEIARPARQVVGVVINTVDDYLAKGDQLRLHWACDTIRPLRSLLDAARDAGRIIVLTSDHGHVLDRDTAYRPYVTESLRCRPDDGAPAADEVVLHGPRVLSPAGNRVIAPWSERVRYGIKQNGYHGGAAPQEVVIPLAVLGTGDPRIPGWSELPPSVPAWWEISEPEGPGEPMARPAPAPALARRPVRPTLPQEELFPHAAVVSTPESIPSPSFVPAPSWLDLLLGSPTYAAQKQLAARPVVEDERVRSCLLALDARGGKLTRVALARTLGVTPLRLAGLLAALRRLLNVDGYAVLAVDEASDTVELNRPLLETQFELDR